MQVLESGAHRSDASRIKKDINLPRLNKMGLQLSVRSMVENITGAKGDNLYNICYFIRQIAAWKEGGRTFAPVMVESSSGTRRSTNYHRTTADWLYLARCGSSLFEQLYD